MGCDYYGSEDDWGAQGSARQKISSGRHERAEGV